MRLQLKLVSIHFMVLLMLCVSFVVYAPKEAYGSTTNLEGLGDISRYNAVVFGNHIAVGGDIEGAIAVQGDMDASGYTIVGAAAGTSNIVGGKWDDEGYPSLLLSGKFKKSRKESFIIQNGIVVMTKESDPDRIIQSSYDRIVYKEKLEINAKFNEFHNIVNQVSKNAGQYKTNTPIPNMSYGIGKDINNPNIYVSSELVGKINLDIRDVFLPNAKGKDFIVMYSDAIEVTFKNGAILYDTNNIGRATDIIPTSQPYSPNSPFTELYGKVIWVFPNAKKITTEGYGVVGSVFAPNAVLETKGGSINGQAFVGAVQQTGGFEFHNFKFNWQHWNKPSTGKVKIKKVDSNNDNKELMGAKFHIEDSNKKVVGELVTDEKGEAISKELPIGNYTLVETEAPKGYELLKDKIAVKIEKDAVVEIKIENKKLPDPMGKMKLVKVDTGDKNKKLAGAKFHIEDSNKEVVGELVTDGQGEAISKELPIGNYTLVEVEAPKGYELLKDKIAVKIEKDKVVEIKIGNKKLPDPTGQFEIEKVDDKDINLKLKGAVFQVLDKEGKEVTRLTTDEKGKVISNQLVLGKYTIKEIKAPNGYMLLRDPIEIEITEAVRTQKLTVKNVKNNWVIPNTGGSGTTSFYVIGFVLMFGVLCLYKKNRI
ncbi:collagen binding domain-containing protein [Bacillus sp. M5A3_1b]